MSMGVMGENEEIQIPAGWAGQIDTELSLHSKRPLENRTITEALQTIDDDIKQLLALRSDFENYGLSKICPVDVTDVTTNNGMVLGATEKNKNMQGTLAQKIESVKEKANGFDVVGAIVQNVANLPTFNVHLSKMGKLGFCDVFVASQNLIGNDIIFYFPDGFHPVGYYYKYGLCEVTLNGITSMMVLQTFIEPAKNSFSLAQNMGKSVKQATVSFFYQIK